MKVKTLIKYNRSRLNGVLIREIRILSNDTIRIISEDGEELEDYVEGAYNFNLSADYIICDLQDRIELKVNKY